jgi:hypothetical protein
MKTEEAKRWAWVNGMLVTANEDGTIPINSRIVLAVDKEHDHLEVQSEAAAAMIAEAPAMLAALRDAAKAVCAAQCPTTWETRKGQSHSALCVQTRDAIAKARGDE